MHSVMVDFKAKTMLFIPPTKGSLYKVLTMRYAIFSAVVHLFNVFFVTLVFDVGV